MTSLPKAFQGKKVCLVTDWLTNLGGAERVVQAVAELFPESPIYTTVANRDQIGDLGKRDIRTSYLQKIPVLRKKHQWLLPLLPKAIESLDVSEYDVVLSFSSFGVKAVKTTKNQKHICYLHTPVRYAWEPDFDPRVQKMPKILQPLLRRTLKKICTWDYETRNRPDGYIANSSTTAERAKKYYDIEMPILYPPVEVGDFSLKPKKDYYIGVGRMVPYKKFVLLAKAFESTPDRYLILVGDGPDSKEVRSISEKTKHIACIGRVDRSLLAELLSEAKALILPQKEDAGIVQLEAFASGTPVIAYRAGGVLDVLQEGKNGVFFDEQSVAGIQKGLEAFEALSSFDPAQVQTTARPFDTKRFQEQYLTMVGKCL